MVLHGIAWYCMVLQDVALYCTVSHCIVLNFTVLHGIALYHCTIVGFGARAVSRKTPTYFIIIWWVGNKFMVLVDMDQRVHGSSSTLSDQDLVIWTFEYGYMVGR